MLLDLALQQLLQVLKGKPTPGVLDDSRISTTLSMLNALRRHRTDRRYAVPDWVHAGHAGKKSHASLEHTALASCICLTCATSSAGQLQL